MPESIQPAASQIAGSRFEVVNHEVLNLADLIIVCCVGLIQKAQRELRGHLHCTTRSPFSM